TWTQAIARRRGKKVAMVALARRLARTLFAMWRDQTDYQVERVRTRRTTRDTVGTIDAKTIASAESLGEVVKSEEQARTDVWPHVRAVLKRALLLLRILPCAGT